MLIDSQKPTEIHTPYQWYLLTKMANTNLSNCYVTLLEVNDNFWSLLRTAKQLEILSRNFKVTSAVT